MNRRQLLKLAIAAIPLSVLPKTKPKCEPRIFWATKKMKMKKQATVPEFDVDRLDRLEIAEVHNSDGTKLGDSNF